MINFRLSNNWLRYRTNTFIQKNHKDLFDDSWKSIFFRVKDYSFDRKRWWLLLFIVISIFYIGTVVNLEFLNIINIEAETAKTIVDQRTGNIAAITSITLVVVGLLINNLAMKESVTYWLLFKRSYVYPIIYFTLSSIGCFFMISMLKDTFEEVILIRLVTVGTYLALVILMLIGYLFNTLIQFTNDKEVKRLLHDELIKEAIINIKYNLINSYSGRLYENELIKIGAKEYNWLDHFDFNSDLKVHVNANDTTRTSNTLMEVYDINMRKLKKDLENALNIGKEKRKVFYKKIALGVQVYEDDYILFEDENQNKNFVEYSITNYALLSSKRNGISTTLIEFFDQKLEEATRSGNSKKLEEILESYFELYALQLDHQI